MQQEIVQIPDYGWVPFPYFQHALIMLLLFSFHNYEAINKKLDKYFYDPLQKKNKNQTFMRTTKISVALIPIIVILYLDIKYSSFSMNNLGVTKYISNDNINTFLKLFGAYCIIQVAAQDVGLKTGDEQADFVKLPFYQFLMYAGASYSITQNRSMSLIATLLYFQLKFFGSAGKTKDVCFE